MLEERSWSPIRLTVTISVILVLVLVAAAIVTPRPVAHSPCPPKTDITRISLALDRYRMNFGRYPPDTGHGLPLEDHPPTYDPGSLWRYLLNEVYDERAKRTYGPFLRDWPRKRRKAYQDPIHGESYVLLDHWGSPCGFVGDPKRVVHNKGSFDLFSVGPDGKTACDEPGAESNVAYDGIDNDGNGIVDDRNELGAAARNGEIGDDINNWTRYEPPTDRRRRRRDRDHSGQHSRS